MTDHIRVCLVGLGWTGSNHYAGYRAISEQADVVAVVARSAEGKARAQSWGIRTCYEVLVESLSLAQGIDPMFRVKGSDAFVRTTVEPALASIVAGKTEVAATLQSVQPLLQGLVDQSPK